MEGICDQAERVMLAILWIVLTYLFWFFRLRHDLALEVLALRHQLMVLKRQAGRPKLGRSDRYFWMLLMRVWPHWRNPLMIFQPETLIGWQRSGFRMFWGWKSRRRLGRPGKDAALIQLIRRMWALNPTWGSPRIRDELAKRGYVCFATDMLNWSDRGGGGQEGQQALAANLFQLGMSFAGLIAHEDLRAAEFLAAQPEVDRQRVAAMGLSVGGFRAWQLAALSDHIDAGVSVCWMATIKGLILSGNNQTRGQSAYTMIHPGLFSFLDYPDVASIACPKPMMFLNGEHDRLFPLPVIEEAYVKIRAVWASQDAADKLETRLYDLPHLFNEAMQADAFQWLDLQFKTKKTNE